MKLADGVLRKRGRHEGARAHLNVLASALCKQRHLSRSKGRGSRGYIVGEGRMSGESKFAELLRVKRQRRLLNVNRKLYLK